MKYLLLTFLAASLVLVGCGNSNGHFERITEIPPGSSTIDGDGYTTPIKQSYVQAYERAAYDLLWVLDNSGSMVDEVNYVRDNMDNFAKTMVTRRQVEYQMAVINTDWRDATWGHGQFRGSVPIVRYDHADPVTEFKNAVNDIHMCANGPCSSTNGTEMGLSSARTALVQNPTFIRSDANLMVIIVTDENDFSCNPKNPANWSSTTCTSGLVPVSTFVSYFKTLKPAGTGVLGFYPVVGKTLTDCNTIGSAGLRYLDTLTGIGVGESGSICENDFANSINRIANLIADNGLCFPLAYDPKRTTIKVSVNGEPQIEGYSYDPTKNSVCFDTNHIPPNGSQVVNEFYRK